MPVKKGTSVKKSSNKSKTKKSTPKSEKKKPSLRSQIKKPSPKSEMKFSPKIQSHTYSDRDMIFYPQSINSMMMREDPPYKYPTVITGNMEEHTNNLPYEIHFKSPILYREELPPLMGRKSLSLGGKKRRTRKYKGAALKRSLKRSLPKISPKHNKAARVGLGLNTPPQHQGIDYNAVMNPDNGNNSPQTAVVNLDYAFGAEYDAPPVNNNGYPPQTPGGKRKSRRKSRRKSMSRR